MIWLPGYGLYPASWLRRASRARFQGQANRELLEAENMADISRDETKASAARYRLLRHLGVDWSAGKTQPWLVGSGISTVGLQQWSLGLAAGRKARPEDFSDQRTAIEILVHEDPKWDEVARRIPRATDGIPVFVQRSDFPVALGDVEGRADDDSTAMAHNWTGTRGGWYDYAGQETTPGGADDMNDVSNEVPIRMLVTGPTLKELLLDTVRAHGGAYKPVDGEWRFFLDPILRVKLALAGLPAPCSVRAEPLVCLRNPPPMPGIGGFIHPGVGVYCRPAGMPPGLEERYRVVLSRASTFGMADIGDLSAAERAATAFNKSLGISGASRPRWWLYTLPRLTTSGAPEIAVGVAGDVTMDRELPASFMGVPLVREIAYPKQGMGSAPIDTVWPTNSPDYHEPTGDATGDDDPAIGDYMGGQAMGNSAFVTMKDLVSTGLNKQDPSWGDDGIVKTMPKGAGTVLIGQTTECWTPVLDVLNEINGELVQSMSEGSATVSDHSYGDADGIGNIDWSNRIRKVQSMPRETFSGQGCPIQAMPVGGLNRGVPTGYEGQPWVNKDWSLGDMASAVGETKKLLRPGRLVGAAVGAAAGFFAVRKFAPEGEKPGSIATTVAAAIGAVSGLLVANAASTSFES